MATTNIIFQELCEICKQSGFHRRGHTFFRVQGDGVLLVLQYERKLRHMQPRGTGILLPK